MDFPELIFNVEYLNGVFKIEANKIEIKNVKSMINNPFESKQSEVVSWDEFIANYQKKYFDLQYYISPTVGSTSMPTRNIETYIKG